MDEEYYSENNSVKRALDTLNNSNAATENVLRELWRDGSTYGYNYG